jgi:hypothetical protein
MQKLDDSAIIRIIREEWESKKATLLSEAKHDFMTASPGLKLKHTKTGLLYTVAKVAPGAVTITSPDGAPSTLSNDQLEDEFELA